MAGKGFNLSMIVLFYYSLSLIIMIHFFSLNSIFYLGDLSNCNFFSGMWLYLTAILNMAGFPPTNFFFLKVMVIFDCLKINHIFLVFSLLVRAGVILYVYLKLFLVRLRKDSDINPLRIRFSPLSNYFSFLLCLRGFFIFFFYKVLYFCLENKKKEQYSLL